MNNINEKLYNAVYCKKKRKLKKLIEKGANVDYSDEDGRSILMHAILAENSDLEIIKILVESGADINYQEQIGQKWSVLHFAVREGNVEIVNFLLGNNDIEIDPQDSFGNTPLWRAVMSFKGNTEIIEKLVEKGADKNKPNKEGVSPVTLAKTIGSESLLKSLESEK